MSRKRVYYNSHGDAELYAMLREAAGDRADLLLLDRDDDAERLEKLALADAAIVASTPLTAALIGAAPRLAFVHHQGVGYHDTVAVEALQARAIPLAITPGGTTVGVAEHTVLLILAMLRQLPYADAELRQGRFHVNALRATSRELAGLTVGLVGAGRIGCAVAERLRPFGVTLVYYDPARLPVEQEAALGLVALTLDELLERADIVSLHLPVTAQTRKLIDAEALGRMKPGSYLVNTARGGLVDEAALVRVLEQGRLAGAALDVFDPEPPGSANPLNRMRNVVLTPHISAGTRDAFLTKMRFVFGNLERFWAGDTVENLVALGPPSRTALTA